MIEIHLISGRAWPLVICDGCHERIGDHYAGHVLWNANEVPGPCYHVHANRCQTLYAQAMRSHGGCEEWDNLDTHLARLVHQSPGVPRGLSQPTR